MAVSIDIKGLEETKKRFKDMQERAKNPSSVMKIIAIKGWRGVVNENFRDEVGKDGQKWAPRQRARSGKRHKGAQKLLQDTGFLRNYTGFRNTIDEAYITNGCKYAKPHNYGSTKKNIPQREFMYVNDKTMLSIMKTMTTYLTDGKFEVS